MAVTRLPSQELLSLIASAIEPKDDYPFTKVRPVQVSTIKRVSSTSSLGSLDCLLPELLSYICNILDFQSLSRLLRVCLQGKTVVESLPAYRALTKYIPTVFRVLASLGLSSPIELAFS